MKAVLVIGSNCPGAPVSGQEKEDGRSRNIRSAMEALERMGYITRVSPVYETPDCLGSGHRYMNAVICLETPYSEGILTGMLKQLETDMGRDEECRRAGLVPLDIDIVIFDDEIRRPADYSAAYFQTGYKNLHKSVSNVVYP